MTLLGELLSNVPVATPATLATPRGHTAQESQKSQGGNPVIAFDRERTRRAIERRRESMETRRRQVLAMLAEAPEHVRYVFQTHDGLDPDHFVMTLAIRGVGTCGLSIERERYDPGTLLALIADANRGASETARQAKATS